MTDETQVERHNRVAYEIAQRMSAEFPSYIERLLLLESIMSGTIKLMVLHLPEDRRLAAATKLFEVLLPGIKLRLKE